MPMTTSHAPRYIQDERFNDRRTPGLAGYTPEEECAIQMANNLNDVKSLSYYLKLVNSVFTTKRFRERHPDLTKLMKLMLDKSEQLGHLAHPAGPLRNPAAVFVNWVKLL